MNQSIHLDVKRIQSLTDATFAVAMTILILEIKIPAGMSHEAIKEYVVHTTLPELLIYFIGFVTLGIFWIGSHFHHHIITTTDRISSWLNIDFLLLICIVPLSVSLLKNYSHDKLSIVAYSANLILISLVNYVMLWYAWRKKYIKPHYTVAQYRQSRIRILIPIGIYLAIIPISFLSTGVAISLFFAPMFLHLIPESGNAAAK
jgi:uncharacterized membrane protein